MTGLRLELRTCVPFQAREQASSVRKGVVEEPGISGEGQSQVKRDIDNNCRRTDRRVDWRKYSAKRSTGDWCLRLTRLFHETNNKIGL